jgi:ribosome-binding protein aMBF1 (putative translation factor)
MNTDDQIMILIRAVVTRSRNGESFEELMQRIREEIDLIKKDERKRLKPLVVEIVSGKMELIIKNLSELLD